MMVRDRINESLLTNEELWEVLIDDAGISYNSKNGNYKLYMHTVPNGKVYIGTTCQTINSRWGKDGKRYKGQYFYKAIEKYGWENIGHYVIKERLNHEEADLLERVFINYYKSNDSKYGYNRTKGGDMHSHKGNYQKVICINTLDIYYSVYSAEKETGINSSTIYLNCIGDIKFAGYSNKEPLCWMFYDDYLNKK